MHQEQLKRILLESRTIAVVGMSADPAKQAHQIPLYLLQHGYRVIPVNPNVTEILGERAFPDLLSIPEPVDVVQLFVRAENVPAVVEQAIQIGAKVIWMQQGITNPEAAQRARAAGLVVVENQCMRAMHRYFFGASSKASEGDLHRGGA